MGRSDSHPRKDGQWQRTFQHDDGHQTGDSGRDGPASAPREPGPAPRGPRGAREKTSALTWGRRSRPAQERSGETETSKQFSGHYWEFSRSMQ